MAKFKIAAVFSDRMVLQRGKNVAVFGTGEDGAKVTVEFEGAVAEATVRDGKWQALLPPHEAGEGYTLTVRYGESVRSFTDVAVGEVWLAGGQSNMELELQTCKTGAERLKNDVTPNVRFYYTQKHVLAEDDFLRYEENSGWSRFDGESAKAWSAVGYFFAKELADRLGCIVGVIGCNWGGTKASHWMSRESLLADTDMRFDLDEYDKACAGKTDEELSREYDEYLKYDHEWYEKSVVFYKDHPDASWDEVQAACGVNKYPGPLCPRNPFHATALYESMLSRVCPYTLRGFLYYQGESDDNRPRYYYKMLRGLITLWRDDWGDDELPFLIVQLPMHRYKADPDYKHWCLIREAQEKAYHTIKNTGLAVILDCGEFNEIHPKDKEPVAHRLYLQAMATAYGDPSVEATAFAPLYHSHFVKERGIEISFVHAESGFELRGEPGGFEIAGADGVYRPAAFELRGEKIFVRSDEVPEPLHVRYLWTNYAEVTLYGKNGLPLAPFRTDKTADQ
ncbi:MAG: sialate O-acetylesterase [Bacteroides sp.]|nr:sialate O-acetylesterase [Eubacterium sp.]MCM1418432.1 sialate O-acetylesterase [Roseburia sp.]MCM1461547.1 sialate O-acetylesterase [Bacteroides sp.]